MKSNSEGSSMGSNIIGCDSEFSLLDGAATPETLAKAAAAQGHSAVALTDHGVMFGTFEFYKKVKKFSIKSILS